MQELTQDTFNETLQTGKTVIDCWAPWCGPCRFFAPVFEETSKEFPDIKFVKLNTDENQQIAQELSIRAIPTIIFVEDGKEVGRVTGALPKDAFRAKVQELLA